MIPWPLSWPCDDFPAFLARLTASARAEGLAPGMVPHSMYWLVNNGAVVAVANLRPALTDRLRREGGHIGYGVRLSARGRAFARTIVGNGVVLDSEKFLAERGEIVQRYRIRLELQTSFSGR